MVFSKINEGKSIKTEVTSINKTNIILMASIAKLDQVLTIVMIQDNNTGVIADYAFDVIIVCNIN